jgi:hypothetical protein
MVALKEFLKVVGRVLQSALRTDLLRVDNLVHQTVA